MSNEVNQTYFNEQNLRRIIHLVNYNQDTMSSSLIASELFNVKGWVVVLTGGGTGVGKMMATCLAENGAKVYITGRRLEKLQETAAPFEGRVIPIVADNTKKEDIIALAKFVNEREDHIDLLVNNAGVTTVNAQLDAEDNTGQAISKRMLEQNFDDWLGPYAVNTASMYFTSVSAAFLPLLMATQDHRGVSGNIVNVTSMSGITKTSQNGQFSYNANKAAARSLSTQLANDFTRPHINVRVNQLALGYFPSEMTKIATSGEEKEHFINKWHIPFGRAGTSEDISKVLLNLATNEYMTDSTQVVDGGYLCVVP
ncbi:hypothetical protein E3Q23_02345 [Wallemia mellicola]|uniref:NAD(P)-binding protein n=1 Tax=Wallemia mellicola TaxID=1708541 RepID=A0A4T0TIS8_9BASI|nr:hypothetical protein E3Q23_02345 [Wallemia mellicola]TIC64735.1 NAD(P)-binding protein [Wallemia mellicola]